MPIATASEGVETPLQPSLEEHRAGSPTPDSSSLLPRDEESGKDKQTGSDENVSHSVGHNGQEPNRQPSSSRSPPCAEPCVPTASPAGDEHSSQTGETVSVLDEDNGICAGAVVDGSCDDSASCTPINCPTAAASGSARSDNDATPLAVSGEFGAF